MIPSIKKNKENINSKFDALEYFAINNENKLNQPNPVKETTLSAVDNCAKQVYSGRTFNELTNNEKINIFAIINSNKSTAGRQT